MLLGVSRSYIKYRNESNLYSGFHLPTIQQHINWNSQPRTLSSGSMVCGGAGDVMENPLFAECMLPAPELSELMTFKRLEIAQWPTVNLLFHPSYTVFYTGNIALAAL